MRNARTIVIGLAALLASSLARADAPKLQPFAPTPYATFEGKLATKAGELAVVARDWIIHNDKRVEKFPESGMVLVELRSGFSATTVIDGKRETRHQGDSWLVPDGATMTVETDRYSVILHTVAVRRAAPVIK
jgi:hypothetical protein